MDEAILRIERAPHDQRRHHDHQAQPYVDVGEDVVHQLAPVGVLEGPAALGCPGQRGDAGGGVAVGALHLRAVPAPRPQRSLIRVEGWSRGLGKCQGDEVRGGTGWCRNMRAQRKNYKLEVKYFSKS